MGGAAGFSPQEVKGMSVWEFLMATEGWKRANGVGQDQETKAPTEEEYDAVLAQYGVT